MRVAVATVSHETNTFAAETTSLEEFDTASGDALCDAFADGRSLEGIVETLEQADIEIVPTYGAASMPSGIVTSSTYETIRTEIVDRLTDENLDGICLDLHGSMYVDGEPDPEGTLLEAIRETVGPKIPVTAALDMHATITGQMVEHLDGVAGYRTAPHTDVVETGERAAELVLDSLHGETELTLAWERLPMLLAGERSETDAEPMETLVDMLLAAERTSGVLDANYFLGFPWADSPHAGCHALVTGQDGERRTIEQTARDVATIFWDRRREFSFTTEAYDLAGALDVADEHDGRPVVIADTGDIPGAGASETTVDALAAILDRDADSKTPLVGVVVDPDALRACESAGEGATVRGTLGQFANQDRGLSIDGTVVATLREENLRAALIDLGRAEVVLADRRTNRHRDPEFFRKFGVDPETRELIVLKSGYLSPAWKSLASRRLFALTPGETNQLLEELPYETVPRPIYPIDEDVDWTPSTDRSDQANQQDRE